MACEKVERRGPGIVHTKRKMTDASTETNVFMFRRLPVAIVSCSEGRRLP